MRSGVRDGNEMPGQAGLGSHVRLCHVADTRRRRSRTCRCRSSWNAVLEHIPQPRAAYIEEIWRVLDYGGTL